MIGIWILGDRLSLNRADLMSCDSPSSVPVVFIESIEHIKARPYHWQKLVLVWSAMRHFAQELREGGWDVSYYAQSPDFKSALITWIQEYQITELRMMEPSDRPFAQMIQTLDLPCQVTLLPDNSFIWSRSEFKTWVKSRKRLVLEDFYREGRKRFNILMDGKKPIGGEWNFDKQNRQPPQGKLNTPAVLSFTPDEIVREVIEVVTQLADKWSFKVGDSSVSFDWGVTRKDALQALKFFVEHRLPGFGTYQDAMLTDEETMWHALISPYLNLGLLHPLEVVKAVEIAYSNNPSQFALNGIEGFIRQVLGWREYMNGIYHAVESDYSEHNWFNHTHSLPDFYWNGNTDMNCLKQVIQQVKKTGYTHHIQRLMILSNFGLIAGISPQELTEWFHTAFIDAYDWVMQTNVIGMGQFADGGILASKPYAASANYINKMSNYCQNCTYDPKQRTGAKACPFNFFYWDFLARHREQLESVGRMQFILKNLAAIAPEELDKIKESAARWHLSQSRA